MLTNQAQQEELRAAVRDTYSAIAAEPADDHPIPVGRALAEGVGYPPAILDNLPAVAVAAFAGVGNVSLAADLSQGSTVLDLGCGAGLDSLIAARRAGPDGQVVGVDFSEAMLARARLARAEQRANTLSLCLADSERLPLRTGSVDVALANGIFNLNPRRRLLFEELHRVLRPGGTAYAAELILRAPLPAEQRDDATNWFA